jgi:hypothetical protein
MIRICQEIVLNDIEDWDYQLINAIKNNETIIRIGKIYDWLKNEFLFILK